MTPSIEQSKLLQNNPKILPWPKEMGMWATIGSKVYNKFSSEKILGIVFKVKRALYSPPDIFILYIVRPDGTVFSVPSNEVGQWIIVGGEEAELQAELAGIQEDDAWARLHID